MKTRLARTVSLMFAALLLAGVSLASAQTGNWSPLQQEVIDHLKDRMNAWVELAKTGDIDTYFARCPVATGTAYWWSNTGAPTIDTVTWVRRNLDQVKDEKPKWTDMVPIAITIHENVAIAHFYAYWQGTRDGKRDVAEYKATEVFKKMNGKWTFLGGQVTPVEKSAPAR